MTDHTTVVHTLSTELNNTFKNYDILFESGRTTWNQKRGRGSNSCWLTLKLKGIE